jgi:hypothetical protein
MLTVEAHFVRIDDLIIENKNPSTVIDDPLPQQFAVAQLLNDQNLLNRVATAAR